MVTQRLSVAGTAQSVLTPATVAARVAADSGDAAPPNMRERLLAMADAESQGVKYLSQLDQDFGQRHLFLRESMPEKYFELVRELRATVQAFNARLVDTPTRELPRLKWTETPNVVLRDATHGDGMRVRVQRNNSYFDLVLRHVHRAGKEDIPIIEGFGSMGRELVRTESLMRIEGWVQGGVVTFRLSLDFKRQEIPLAEVPTRIVMAVAAHDYTLLSRTYLSPTSLATLPDPESNPGS